MLLWTANINFLYRQFILKLLIVFFISISVWKFSLHRSKRVDSEEPEEYKSNGFLPLPSGDAFVSKDPGLQRRSLPDYIWAAQGSGSKIQDRAEVLESFNLLVPPKVRLLKSLESPDGGVGSGHSSKRHIGKISRIGEWSTWPECLCGAPEGLDCIQTLQPKSDHNTRYGEGGTCSWRAWSESSDMVISTSIYGPATKCVDVSC